MGATDSLVTGGGGWGGGGILTSTEAQTCSCIRNVQVAKTKLSKQLIKPFARAPDETLKLSIHYN